MGACWTKTKEVVAGFMVYDTVSIVRINDARLAILHYLCMIAIVGYIVIYTIWINQAYNKVEAPVGTVRVNVMAPSERDGDQWLPIDSLNYCLSDNHTSLYEFPIYKCKYYDSLIDVFPQAVDSSVTIATRIKYSLENATNKEFDTPNSSWVTDSKDYYYLADIERFSLQIDHTYYAPGIDIQDNARNMKGYIRDKHDNIVKLCYPLPANNSPTGQYVEVLGKKGVTDILSVCTLLRAAGVNIDKEYVQANESIRDSGAIFLVFLDYQNACDLWFRPNTHYTVTVEMIDRTEYKAVQAVYTKKLDSRTIYNRHGLHFVFLQTGQLVKFDFQVLLLSLVSGMGMIALSTTIVDLISTKLLGNKDVVSNLKYRTTPNLTRFSDDQLNQLADKLRRIQEQELALNTSEGGYHDKDQNITLREPLVDRNEDE